MTSPFHERLIRANALPTRFDLPTLSEMWAAIPGYRRNRQFWLGLAAGAAVLLLLAGASVAASLDLGHRTVRAEFAQTAGLRAGDTVDVAGIEVGSVTGIRLAGDRVVATLAVRDDVRLGPDATAAVEMSTILGKMHVELDPGDGGGLPGALIGLDRTRVPYNLAKVVDDPAYTNAFERVERLDTAGLRTALDTVAHQLGDSPALTAQALDSVGVLAGVIADRHAEVDALLKNIDAVARLVDDNRNGILLLITRGQAVGDAVAQRQTLLRGLLDDIATVSKSLRDMGVDNDGRLAPLIHDLDTMTQGLTRNRENLDRLYQSMPVALRQLNNAFGNGPYGEVYLPWGLFPDNWLCTAQVVAGCAR
ncbi:MlaD family protein [Nocardia thailandica]|uniref:MlaD family protein n=1 Tax=Nocardia thailandica TaxID=257275 RepID=A0ABW6PV81_9NOCA